MDATILTSLGVNELQELISNSVREQLSLFKPINEEEKPVKIEEICDLLCLSKVTIHEMKRKGMIPFHRIGRNVYFYKSEVLKSLKKIDGGIS